MKYVQSLLICGICVLVGCMQEPAMQHNIDHPHDQNQLYLTVREQQLAGIKTDSVRTGEITEKKNMIGIVAVNGAKQEFVVSRVSGRVEKLFVRNANEYIRKGDPILTLYSEELFADEQDYINAFMDATPTGKMIAAATKNRLVLWGLSPQEILFLENTKIPQSTKTVVSTSTGTVTTLYVSEGEYLDQGARLVEVTDISSVWVEVQIYADEAEQVYGGAIVNIRFRDLPDKEYSATPEFQTPLIERNSKTSLARYVLDNADQSLRPGMMADIVISFRTKTGLIIPASALLMEKEPVVWIELEAGLFEKRMVTLGLTNKEEVEILSGVEEGEKVVTGGSYLLNSEFVLRNGANSMGGMIM